MTAEEFVRMPDVERYELVEGKLRYTPPGPFICGLVGSNVGFRLGSYVRKSKRTMVTMRCAGFVLRRDPDTVLGASCAVVGRDRLPSDKDCFVPGAPDLAVELAAPGCVATFMSWRARQWMAAGCRLLWIVWTDKRQIEVHRPGADVRVLGEGDVLDGEDVLPGFRCSVAEILELG